jgi:hypothetical protein
MKVKVRHMFRCVRKINTTGKQLEKLTGMITNLPSALALLTDPIQSLGLGDVGLIIAAFVFVMSCECRVRARCDYNLVWPFHVNHNMIQLCILLLTCASGTRSLKRSTCVSFSHMYPSSAEVGLAVFSATLHSTVDTDRARPE